MKENLIGINALADAFFEYRKEIVKIKFKIYTCYIIAALSIISFIPVWKLSNFESYNYLVISVIYIFLVILSIIMVVLAKSMKTMLKILRKKMLDIFEHIFCLRKIIKKEDVEDVVLLDAIDLKLFLIDPNV